MVKKIMVVLGILVTSAYLIRSNNIAKDAEQSQSTIDSGFVPNNDLFVPSYADKRGGLLTAMSSPIFLGDNLESVGGNIVLVSPTQKTDNNITNKITNQSIDYNLTYDDKTFKKGVLSSFFRDYRPIVSQKSIVTPEQVVKKPQLPKVIYYPTIGSQIVGTVKMLGSKILGY